jgi:hypothetical protein
MGVLSTILAVVSNLPTLVGAYNMLKPVKRKILEVEKKHEEAVKVIEAVEDVAAARDLKTKLNEDKHIEVIEYLKWFLLPKLKRYGIDESDIDTTVKFIVLFIKKLRKLRRFRG